MSYKTEEEREIIHAHSTGGSMNNPSIQQQQVAGVELTGRVTDPDDNPPMTIVKGKRYFDTREEIYVVPVTFHDDRIRIEDGRSCTVTYAKNYWTETV